MARMARIGLLTGGGDCPGLNPVIRAVVRKGIDHYGHEIFGFRKGWRGVLDNDAVELTRENTSGILHKGGTILGTSRTNVYKEEDGEERVLASLRERQRLVLLGPRGLLAVARLHDAGHDGRRERQRTDREHRLPHGDSVAEPLFGVPHRRRSLSSVVREEPVFDEDASARPPGNRLGVWVATVVRATRLMSEQEADLADSTPVAVAATSVPTPDDISRAEKFTREAFVHGGETVEDALARGTARRRALDAALAEIDAGAKLPSPEWRRRYSLMLGLERVLSDDEPRLADGTSLNPHQVDALSGTLTALLAEAQRNGADAPAPAAAPVLALDDEQPLADPEPSSSSSSSGAAATSPRTSSRWTSRSTSTTTTTRPTSPTPTRTRREPPSCRSTRTSSRRRPTIPTRTSASGSSMRPAPARRSPRWASSRRRGPAASSSSPTAATSSTSSTASCETAATSTA